MYIWQQNIRIYSPEYPGRQTMIVLFYFTFFIVYYNSTSLYFGYPQNVATDNKKQREKYRYT